MCPRDRIGIDKIRCGKRICYEKVTINPINIKRNE
jgi:hypothetical protein